MGLLKVSAAFIFNGLVTRIDKLEATQKVDREALQKHILFNSERCAAVHEREADRLSKMATKEDIAEVRREQDAGFNNINNNLLMLAGRIGNA